MSNEKVTGESLDVSNADSQEQQNEGRLKWVSPTLVDIDVRSKTAHSIGPIYTDGSFAPKAS
ncbi:hypothetical protein [Methylomonas methanica]|uniref:Uncharacterized protein n=1 Tax=Methylomonas methanica (strain DSM 25384 / MC09) TaxID=857087 RepID=F9ZW57_METMM|nr:hypothetical protein [Methylomonas methanica]AEG02028.1 hypothetical protein Metme_3667 [Methylomonas methanica MC09]